MTDSKTLGVGDVPLDVTDWTLRIAKIEGGKVSYADGPMRKPLIQFEGISKPLAAGATVMTQIVSLYGTDTPSKMIGKLVTLYATKTDSFGKKGVDCLRVRPRIPKDSDLWGAKYDHADTLRQFLDAVDEAEIEAIRATLNSRKPPKENHDEIKAAIVAAIERVKSAPTADTPTVDEAAL